MSRGALSVSGGCAPEPVGVRAGLNGSMCEVSTSLKVTVRCLSLWGVGSGR